MHVQVEKNNAEYIIFTNQNKYSVQDNIFGCTKKWYLREIQYSWENISNVSM